MLALPFFKKALKFKGFPLQEARDYFSQIPRENLLEWQDEKKWEIARYHLANNPFYKDKLGDHLPTNWESLPVLQKEDFQTKIENLFSTGYTAKNCYVSNTSGSSGHPMYFAKDYFSHALSWVLIEERYRQFGVSLDDKQARFYGIPLDNKGYYKERLKDFLSNRVRFVVFDLSDDNLESFLNRFRKTSFKFIYGYTNSLVLFARYLLKHNLILTHECPSLNLCIVTSELCTKEDLEILQKAFQIPVVNEYGASEFGLIAMESPSGKRKIADELLYVEVLDDQERPVKEGEVGNLVVTSLFNKAMPFIRFKIGDIGSIETYREKYNVLKTIQGRENDTIYLPSGKVAPGFTFYYLSREILEKEVQLKEFTIRQTALDHFVFDISTLEPLQKETKRKIQQLAEKYLEKGIVIEFNIYQKLTKENSGKIKHFYSDIV